MTTAIGNGAGLAAVRERRRSNQPGRALASSLRRHGRGTLSQDDRLLGQERPLLIFLIALASNTSERVRFLR